MLKTINLKNAHKIFTVLLLTVFFYSCSTQKDRLLNRSYHKVAAHYNGYFNAVESLKEALLKLEKNHQEDYSNLLPTSILGDTKQAQKIYPQLNRVIDKAALVVENHSMEIKGKEKNKWIEDAYFIMGKALFYKQEYGKAIEMFTYVTREYEGYISDLSLIWCVRAHIEMGNFTTAKNQLLYLESDARLKNIDKGLLAEVYANYHLKKEDWEEMNSYIHTTIKYTKSKAKKARLTFILAQLYQKLEDYEMAYLYFDKVVKMNPDYQFKFNALLSRARAFDPKRNDSSKLINEIEKMLKDDKNIDYKDQIYFALAEIALKEDNTEDAKIHLLNSTASNLGNDQQQSISHLTLANLYFDEASYLPAQGHYDTAMTFLSQNHPDYEALSIKRNNLNELVELYNTITLQDSLMTLSNLNKEDLLDFIDEYIEELKEADLRAQQSLQANIGARQNTTNSRNQFNPMAGGGGAWYFYNPSAVSFGYSEFITKWGERKLEDNWRRKNKQQNDSNQNEEDEDKDLYSQEYYLGIIPTTDSAKRVTVDLIVQSFYQLGLIYKEELRDYEEALEVFETLLSAYPKNKYEALTYYQLYTIHLLLNETLYAQNYFTKLQQEYPESDYVKMILDPDSYYAQNTELVDSALYYYEEVYELFVNNAFTEVINRVEFLTKKYNAHPVADQLHLLKALANGHLFGEDELISSLNELLAVFNSGEVADEARAILQGIEASSQVIEETIYSLVEEETHFYVLAIETPGPSINKLKMILSDYNKKFYNTEMYKTQSLMLNLNYQLIIVKSFENSNTSLKYLEAVKELYELKSILGRSDFEHFIISSSNFKVFYKNKSLDQYLVYFEDAFLKY